MAKYRITSLGEYVLKDLVLPMEDKVDFVFDLVDGEVVKVTHPKSDGEEGLLHFTISVEDGTEYLNYAEDTTLVVIKVERVD